MTDDLTDKKFNFEVWYVVHYEGNKISFSTVYNCIFFGRNNKYFN